MIARETTAHGNGWAATLADDIDSAQTRVTMTALSMLPPRIVQADDISRLWLALIHAAERGIEVTIALPAPSEAHPATLRNHTTALTLRAARIGAVLVPPARLLHAKTTTIDAAIAWIGSGNITAAAAHHNRELYLRTTDPRTVAEAMGWQRQQLAEGEPAWPK
jgi:phosphatidylserine/phosphatidylglycerophosphate/cardiolipin synthase-like enzyme